jgi:hypothetical protein
MHTKEELTRKRIKPSEQLDLVETISTADKLKHKRLWLYLALFVTTGLSLIFWLYRSLKTVNFSPKLPQINLNLTQGTSKHLALSPQLSTLLSQNPDIVGFYLGHDHPLENITYGSVPQIDSSSLESSLSSKAVLPKSPDTALLPDGIVYHEQLNSSDNQTTLTSLISNPIDKILIVIRYRGSSDSLKTIAPDLISAAYWNLSSN